MSKTLKEMRLDLQEAEASKTDLQYVRAKTATTITLKQEDILLTKF